MDFWEYFHASYVAEGIDNEVIRVEGNNEAPLGERSFGYLTGNYAAYTPDRVSARNGGVPAFYDQTSTSDHLRAVYFEDNYRVYFQTVCFINFRNSRGFDRAEYLHDLVLMLAKLDDSAPAVDPTPALFGLVSAYPNPFNSQARIVFCLPQAGQAAVSVLDCQGRMVLPLTEGRFST